MPQSRGLRFPGATGQFSAVKGDGSGLILVFHFGAWLSLCKRSFVQPVGQELSVLQWKVTCLFQTNLIEIVASKTQFDQLEKKQFFLL